ncbi:MAG: ATP synthase F0 subunit B [Desulfobacteraceae bacterium]|nr:ATP synthase F0 subunit B [Desulfobacteraceae bacterium]MDH3720931.1 ATP synthase F0 subunit B [Desulfobacteraceae bacterium]MDH3874323.1 ATP synthase F0 subunit B [Desulfobacteraceae bacterium]MDH3880057.1 ATP synthase F0 subunit B [Desulfobacteraceae bacterium]
MMVIMTMLFFCYIGVSLASSEGETKSKGWVATDTYKVMNFGVLAIGLFLLMRKPVSQALNSRISGIKEQLSELEEKKQAAEKQLAEYTEKFSSLEQETEKLIEDYIRQGNAAKARIIDEAKKSAEKLEEQARRNIDHEFKQAKLELQQEILEKALEKSEKILKDKITAKDEEKLVDEYLDKVVA